MSIEIEAHAYDIEIADNETSDGEIRSEIRLWCLNRNSDPCLLRVRDFPVFCKVELPILKDSYGDPISWDEERCGEIVNDINKKLIAKELKPIRDWEYKKMKKLYYYTPPKKKYPFLILIFDTINHMYETSKLCKKLYTRRYGQLALMFYEMKIPIYNKMFSLQQMSMTDKFICKGKEIDSNNPERISKDGPSPNKYNSGRPFKEYEIIWSTMKPSKDIWFSYPVICSFDIESYSNNHRTFPEKHNDEDVIFSISITISRYMDIDNRKDYIIIIGDTLPVSEIDCPSAKEGKLIVINVRSEEELFDKFYEIIDLEDPDIFTGYNIYGFDFDYMNVRILDSGNEWPNLSRLTEDAGGNFKIEQLNWSSSGRGANKMYLPKGSGRISFDMFKYIQMDYTFSVYTLDAMAQEFLKEKKDDLKYHEMFEIYGQVKEVMKKGEPFSEELLKLNSSIVKYNVQDSLLVTRLFEKLSVWVSVIELSSVVRVLPVQFCTRGQLMRCMAQIYHVASWKDIVLSTIDVRYNFFEGGYVAKPIMGYWPLVLCFDFNSLYPSIIIAYNLCYSTWVKDIDKHIEKHGIDSIHIFEFDQEEPADWKPPKSDKFDYAGYVKPEDEKEDEKEEEKEEEKEDEKEEGEGKVKGRKKKKEVNRVKKHYKIAFCKKEFHKGFIPEIEENLLSNRKKAKGELKKVEGVVKSLNKFLFSAMRENNQLTLKDIKDPDTIDFLNKVGITDLSTILTEKSKQINKYFDANNTVMVGFLDARQKGLKVCANSLYGFFGAVNNEIYFVQASNIITFMGRSLIIESGHFFEKHYGAEVVYGDSILPDEPVFFLDPDGNFLIEEIGIVSGDRWVSYDGFKLGQSNRSNKQQTSGKGYKVWSKGEWHQVKRFIRHKTNKKIYRIFTDKGVVDVTEDHSLLDYKWNTIKPEDCIIGTTKLAHSYPNLEYSSIEFSTDFEDEFICSTIYNSKKELANYLFTHLKKGYNYRIDGDKDTIYVMYFTGNDKKSDIIRKIELVNSEYTDYVYDIETENGHYQAGIGSINVKNTDSTMVHVPSLNDDPTKVWELAQKMENHINGKNGSPSIFVSPLYLEAEKMMRAIFMKKKHYVYFVYDRKGNIVCINGTDTPKLESKGILLARRDNCKWSRFIYKDIVMSVFNNATPDDIFKKIINVILEVVEVDYKTIVEKFSIVKRMGTDYKSKTTSMFIFSEEMKIIKRPVQPGDRVCYVVVKDHKNRKRVGEKMRGIDLFYECWDASGLKYGDVIPDDFEPEEGMYPPEELDSIYYISNVLMKPIDRLFNCVFNRIIEPYTKVGYKPHKNKRLGKAFADTPVQMIVQMIKDNKKCIDKKGFKCMAKPIKGLIPWFEKIEQE